MSSNPQPFIRAAQKYGSTPAFDAWARKTYGVSGPALLDKLAKGESGFDMNAVSSAGARGGTQFMPATRSAFIKRYGVDPWANPDQAVHATELYLLHDSRGLAGYNPGDPSYTSYILAQKVGGVAAGGKVTARTGGRASGRARPTTKTTTTTTTPGIDNSAARRQLIGDYLSQGGVRSQNATLALAQGWAGVQDVPGATKTTTRTTSSPGPRAASAPRATGTGLSPHARPGDPVVSSQQSVGGLHPTEGLAGYPAHDYFAPSGSHAVAPISGTVVKLSGHDPAQGPVEGPHGPLGWSVYIQGTDGKTYFLTHLGSRNVKQGQTVKQGQIIGTVADYAKYGTPSHIHMGVNG